MVFVLSFDFKLSQTLIFGAKPSWIDYISIKPIFHKSPVNYLLGFMLEASNASLTSLNYTAVLVGVSTQIGK